MNCGYCRDCKHCTPLSIETTSYWQGEKEKLHGWNFCMAENGPRVAYSQDETGAVVMPPDFGCVQFEAKQ